MSGAARRSRTRRSSRPPCCGSTCRPRRSGSRWPAPRRSASRRAATVRNRPPPERYRRPPCRVRRPGASRQPGNAWPHPRRPRAAQKPRWRRSAPCRARRSDRPQERIAARCRLMNRAWNWRPPLRHLRGLVDLSVAANCLSFGREIALSFSSSNARIRTSIRRNNQTPMASMWGKLWHSRCARGGMPGPHCGSAASLENCGVRVPGVRDCAVLRQTPSRMKRAEGTGAGA